MNLNETNICIDELIKPIFFRADYFDLSTFKLPERIVVLLNNIPYLKLFVDSDQYTPLSGNGTTLEFTGKGNYLSIRSFRTGFSAQFDYSEYEIVSVIKELCYYSITNESYIQILDTLNPSYKDGDYILRTGIIQSPIQHKGRIQYKNPNYLIDGMSSTSSASEYKYAIPGGFNLTFLDKNSSYL